MMLAAGGKEEEAKTLKERCKKGQEETLRESGRQHGFNFNIGVKNRGAFSGATSSGFPH